MEKNKLSQKQSHIMHFVNKGGVIAATFGRCYVEYQKIPYRFTKKTLDVLIRLDLIMPAGSIGNTQMYIKKV